MTAPAREGVTGLHVAVVNWRDEGHPGAGGAELYAGEMARALAAQGADVTFFTARGHGQARVEHQDGVRYLRRGGRWTVYPHVLARLLIRRRRIDAVLDCQNGIPFFTPLVLRRRTAVICVIHHVHQDQFALHFPRPVAAIGRFLEGPMATRVYGSRPAAAVSPSARAAVRRRLRWGGPVFVIPNGTPALSLPGGRQRSLTPTIVTVTRLVRHKQIELLVQAAAELIPSSQPALHVHIVGTGPGEAALRDLVRDLDLTDHVSIHGYVDEATKASLLAAAWLTVNPTAGEGWGLGVIEAAGVGVPALAFDVPGMRDSIRPGTTGWLVPVDTDLAPAIDLALTTLRESEVVRAYGSACRQWAASFTWPDSTDRMARLVAAEYDARRSRYARRRHSDLVMLSEFSVVDPEAFVHRARMRLRGTDRFGVDDDRAWVLAYGSDDRDLDAVVAALGGSDAVHRVAVASDLLRDVPELDVRRPDRWAVTTIPHQRPADDSTKHAVGADGDAVA